MEEQLEFEVEKQEEGIRIDCYITEKEDNMTRSYLQKLIKEGKVLLNHNQVKANYKVKTGDKIFLTIPKPEVLDVKAENLPLDILYEDKDIIVINKGKGMVVHPSPGHWEGTLVNALLYHCKEELSGINGILRPGIVHRIDRDTTGVLVVCKNDTSHASLAEQLKVHSITRKYLAVVYGHLKQENGTINAPIGRHPMNRKKMAVNPKGKDAITHYHLIKNFHQNFAYIECQLETGRTHQIRVHMSSIGHPLLGDTVYGPEKPKWKLDGQLLHAKLLGFLHPTTQEYMEFEAPIPDSFQDVLNKLEDD